MKRETGFSLIELLVAMAVTLVIVAATLGLFTSALRTNESSQQLSNMNGNLRSAMNLMTRDLLQAGQGIPTGGVLLPTGSGCKFVNRPVPVGTSTFVYGCTNSGTNPNLPAVVPGNAIGPIVPDTPPGPNGANLGSPNLSWVPSPGPSSDLVTMMFSDNTLVTNYIINGPILTPNYLITISSSSMTFSNATPITGGSNTANIGDIFLVSGGGLSRYVVVTSVSGQTVNFASGDVLAMNQASTPGLTGTVKDLNTGGGVPFSASPACPQPAASPAAPYTSPPPSACAATAQRVLMVSYWLDITQMVNGQVIPRLMRQIGLASPATCAQTPPPLNGCPRAVAEVIESLELSYDYVNGTVPVNNQVSSTAAATACACTITDNQIRKVNLYLAGRSDAPISQTNQYLRNNLATQVDLRSLAFVNRYCTGSC
ncbi:MAG TPA: prepilin-type N-terminal cleavage/methylation domain-containing protein [Candidatus Acidoferrales bacterium]|nr:prepilin-type N-terminal cleavage/methylation domain-containing protein [Candidatus Acidoferrales bacterium]